MTDARTRRNGTDASTRFRPTMGDLRHAHPEAREAFGAVFQRGPAVTDGGRPERDADGSRDGAPAADARTDGSDEAASDADDEDDQDESEQSPDEEAAARAIETMRDLEHTPPYGDDVEDVWERGTK